MNWIWAMLIVAGISATVGLVLKFVVPRIRKDSKWHISLLEFTAVSVVISLAVGPAVFAAGSAWATADALRYQEFYNGVETAADQSVTQCRPGESGSSAASGQSNCRYQYFSGQTYEYLEAYQDPQRSCNAKGECSTTYVTKFRSVTGYIYFPYTTKEYVYTITDSLGGTYRFPDTYVKDGEGYQNGGIPAEYPRGDPKEWIDAKKRLDEGNPRPVTRLFDYDNYILASKDSLLVPYSDDVAAYLQEGILPDHTANITTDPLRGFNDSSADKVRFVGLEGVDEAAWQTALMGFNAALGSKYRGDLHLVLINSALVTSRVNYLNALKAYWLGDDFGRRAIAKNAIIVVAGVSGDMIEWADATTGMPYGNETTLQGIQDQLHDVSFDPAIAIGAPRTVVSADGEATVTLSANPGVLEQVILQDFEFKRACMECDPDEGIGYANMVEIQPELWQWAVMISIVAAIAIGCWLLVGMVDVVGFLKAKFAKQRPQDVRYGSSDPYASLYRTRPYGRGPHKQSSRRK